jgi:hypothetical protein
VAAVGPNHGAGAAFFWDRQGGQPVARRRNGTERNDYFDAAVTTTSRDGNDTWPGGAGHRRHARHQPNGPAPSREADGTAWQAGTDACEALAPEAGLMARLDPADLGRSVVSVLGRAAIRPADVAAAWARFGAAMATLGPAAAAWWLGWRTAPPVTADRRDRRFADASWEDNPFYVALRQGYLATTQLGEDLLAAGSGDPITDQKARLAVGFAADALAPTNFPATNPAAVKRAIDTGGASVLAGARNFLDDLAHNGGRPRQVDAASFELGRNLAATPGQGRIPQRPYGADPVRAADQAGARDPAAGQPSMDQQVLRHGSCPGAELHRVGRRAPAHRFRDLIPQPGRLDGRREPR